MALLRERRRAAVVLRLAAGREPVAELVPKDGGRAAVPVPPSERAASASVQLSAQAAEPVPTDGGRAAVPAGPQASE